MKVSIISVAELDGGLLTRWRALQRFNHELASPFFAPEFTLAVGAVREDVRVAVLEDAQHDVVGLLPFQQQWGHGEPVGAPLSDHHGMVCTAGLRWSWEHLLRNAGLASWRFDRLPLSQAPRGACVQAFAPTAKLSRKFDHFSASLGPAGAACLVRLEGHAARMADACGPLRFYPHSDASDGLAAVLRLRSRQLRRAGQRDCLNEERWLHALLDHLLATESPHCAPRLSALYAGDTLVAAHLGIRSERVWHRWLAGQDLQWEEYWPGTQLLLRVLHTAALSGCDHADFGRADDGGESAALVNASAPVAEGFVAGAGFATAFCRVRREGPRWLRTLPILQPLRPLVQGIRRWRQPVRR
ncbi:GNAT family N-acetyltransferase [Ramlibacter sp. AN1015]|uniref:GNAT family N-acetyltransferase n=1 Tax=Ramlibacter sp. AN1015 TaxID=3133428 RepID=UPI0030C4F4E8